MCLFNVYGNNLNEIVLMFMIISDLRQIIQFTFISTRSNVYLDGKNPLVHRSISANKDFNPNTLGQNFALMGSTFDGKLHQYSHKNADPESWG